MLPLSMALDPFGRCEATMELNAWAVVQWAYHTYLHLTAIWPNCKYSKKQALFWGRALNSYNYIIILFICNINKFFVLPIK